jgi:TonB family protein
MKLTLICSLFFFLFLGLSCGPKPQSQPQAKNTTPVKEQPKEAPFAKPNADLPLTRTSDDINSTVSGHMGGVSYCYEKNVTGAGRIKGQIMIAFTIATDGSVSNVTVVQSDIDNPAFIECLRDRILHWRFDQISPRGEATTVQYPFEFGY